MSRYTHSLGRSGDVAGRGALELLWRLVFAGFVRMPKVVAYRPTGNLDEVAMGIPMDRSGRIFAPLTANFQQAYPTLESALIEFVETDFGHLLRSGVWDFARQGGLMACANSSCRRGGYEFDFIVSGMVRENLTEKKIDMMCPGDEGSPKGRRKGQTCDHMLEGTIKLRYKAPGASASAL